MSAWTAHELARVGQASELQVATSRPDGSISPFVTIWVVRSDENIYVRSAHGPSNPWFQRALNAGNGRIRAGGVERDVTFEVPGAEVSADVTAAYHAKYDRYGPGPVGSVVTAEAVRSTLRVVPI
jgi:hypothetical protein